MAADPRLAPILDRIAAIAEERFLAGTGPGGQNVNKVATSCQLSVAIDAIGLHPAATARLADALGSRLTVDGRAVITARRFRTQDANRADARQRLALLILGALDRPERRIPTRPGRAARARRVDAKKQRGAVKAGRRVSADD